ncbi:MAG TPA: hypothetical protein VHT70_01985 [Candidatus Saccharimonadales bacterium]|jgi:hypothetical protein|nr:hypothetical protein [Candidatus Saccharimonadales bacterium]
MAQVSSTGELGFNIRSDERAYNNYTTAVTNDNLDTFQIDLESHLAHADTTINETHVTRSVLRTVIEGSTLTKLLAADELIHEQIEAATPLPQIEGQPSEYLVYFAKNALSRTPDEATKEDLRSKIQTARDISTASTRKQNRELTFTPVMNTSVSDPTQLHQLWGETFGWDEQGCIDFAKRLEDEASAAPGERTVWFKGMENPEGELLACAMAERLDIPGVNGDIALIEHTEWSTAPSQRGKGLGRQVVQSLTTDIQESMRDTPHLIFAECNLTSGAHVVAAHSGFTVPSFETPHGTEVDQIIFNNVRVSDGLEPQDAYRSFMFTVVE